MPLNKDTYLHALRRQQRALVSTADQVSRQPNIDPLVFFPVLLASVSQTLDVKNVAIHLLDDQKQQLHLIEQIGGYPREQWQLIDLHDQGNPTALALRLAAVQYGNIPQPVMSAPVIGVELPLGTLTIQLPEQADYLKDDWEEFLLGMGYLAGIALEHSGLINELLSNIDELQELRRREAERAHMLEFHNKFLESTNTSLQNLVVTDPLTGLANRRRLMDALQQEISRSQRTGVPFCLCMADLDFFKAINDELGHQVGDQALVWVAAKLRANVRQLDVVGRYGGEEFMLILSNCLLETAGNVAEKLRKVVEEQSAFGPFSSRGGFRVSLGVVQYQPGMDVEQLINAADQALYRAKANGRNRIEVGVLDSSLPSF